MDVNYFGYVHAARAALPYLLPGDADADADGAGAGRPPGHLVVVSSQYAKMAAPYQAGYSASKWALEGYFHTLREELRPHGVGVTVHYPGGVRTEVQGKFERAGSTGAAPGAAGVQTVRLEMPDFFLAGADECARHIWLSHDRGAREAYFPPYVRALHFARGLWPEAVDRGFHALVRLYFERLEVMRFAEEEERRRPPVPGVIVG